MANGPQLTTVPFSDKRCVHTSRQDRLLCLTPIVSPRDEKHFRCKNNKKYTPWPILRGVQVTHEYPDLRMSFNYLAGQNRDNKLSAPHAVQSCHRCLRTLLRSLDAYDHSSNALKLYRLKLRLCTLQDDFFPISLVFCKTGNRKACIWLHGASSR